MPLTLDPQTEQRIQQAVLDGGYTDANELINYALDQSADEGKLLAARKALGDRLELAWQECETGDGIDGERIEEMLAERYARRVS